MNRITPFLWFESQAEEAAAFYVSIFKNSKITMRSPITVAFELDGQLFVALNGGAQPGFKFNPATSFVIDCKTQAEVDYFWEKLGAGGKYSRCGWLDDKFGVTWQVVPSELPSLIAGPDREASQRAMQAMMGMAKLDIAAMKKAYDGK